MALPTLSLLPEHLGELSRSFEDTFASLANYFTLAEAREGDDIAAAGSVAALLADVVHASDVDCDYYPCTLTGADPTSDAFFAALGVARDARCEVSGWDNPKLAVDVATPGAGAGSALALISRLNESELASVDEYIGDGDREAIDAALVRLAALGPIVGVQLCTDDGASKLILTLARRPGGAHVGVLTVRVET